MPRRLQCVYCLREATTRDHVIPRCLLERPYPQNLPTVPSCRSCNEGFSQDEEYFLALMAKTGFEPSLISKVEEGGIVDRMLTRSAGLDALFVESAHVSEDGRVFILPDELRIANITRKVAFGLFCHRYTPSVLPDLNDFLALKPVHNLDNTNFIFVMIHNERFQPRRWKHVQTLTPKGGRRIQVFDYMFVRNQIWRDFGRLFCIMRFHETLWAAVRCPHPPNRKSKDRRIGNVYVGQGQFSW